MNLCSRFSLQRSTSIGRITTLPSFPAWSDTRELRIVNPERRVALLTLCLYLCLISSVTAAFAGPAEKKTVVILKQLGSAHDIFQKNALATFTVEVASDKASQEKGLSGRHSLPADSGMLFTLEPGRPVAFWMKDMKFPIDIIVLDRGRRIIGIMRDLQPCSTQCPTYNVSVNAAYALEINAGLADKYGITVGDTFVSGNE